MFRTLHLSFLCFIIVAAAGGCTSRFQSAHRSSLENQCVLSMDGPRGWHALQAVPEKYNGLPGVKKTEKVLNIFSNPDGSGLILYVTETIPVSMSEFQKGVYELMDQRGKGAKKNQKIKKYRCINSYKSYGCTLGIDSYYEYWVHKDSNEKVKGVRRTYFTAMEGTVRAQSKIMYSNFNGYDTNLISFSDLDVSSPD